MIQFEIGKDGDLELIIAAELWAILRDVALTELALQRNLGLQVVGEKSFEVNEEFISVRLGALAKDASWVVTNYAKSDEPICPPFTVDLKR